jgi:predicted Rossmann fold nucleotide-binding protein DprA/Smf involved in DNA uptake
MEPPSLVLTPQHAHWPHRLDVRLGETAPPELHAQGDPALLAAPLTALFCSARCPGEAILRAYDQAAHWRDTGRAVIGGFHSPMEKECLRILLRGPQPIILCPARGLPQRLPPELHPALLAGRLLILSPFPDSEVRVTRELAERRNRLVAALASEVWFAHISPDGQMAELAARCRAWFPAGLTQGVAQPLTGTQFRLG